MTSIGCSVKIHMAMATASSSSIVHGALRFSCFLWTMRIPSVSQHVEARAEQVLPTEHKIRIIISVLFFKTTKIITR